MRIPVGLLGLLLMGGFDASAQAALPPESRQFDFWIGEWDVTNPAGKAAGRSRIEAIAGGAGLLETWTGATGYSGRSLNAWNAARKQWQQFWVGSDGGVLELNGGLVDGRMVLTGEHNVRGRHLIERITWTPNADGSVRQHWEQSADAGKTWTTAFDGLYRKKAG
ncbi:MAG: hypothetical protein JNG82_08315 [Opitutaceae bacterium]|nr:hypothetical protein [Opitutaceae bacterium]